MLEFRCGWVGVVSVFQAFTSYMLNMFRTLIYPSSGACDYSVELPHWSYCSWFDECWSFGVVGVVSVLQAEACNTDRVGLCRGLSCAQVDGSLPETVCVVKGTC